MKPNVHHTKSWFGYDFFVEQYKNYSSNNKNDENNNENKNDNKNNNKLTFSY